MRRNRAQEREGRNKVVDEGSSRENIGMGAEEVFDKEKKRKQRRYKREVEEAKQ